MPAADFNSANAQDNRSEYKGQGSPKSPSEQGALMALQQDSLQQKLSALEKYNASLPDHHSWEWATNLHDAGLIKSKLNRPDARQELWQSAELLREGNLHGAPPEPARSRDFAQAVSDYADFLLKSKPTDTVITKDENGKDHKHPLPLAIEDRYEAANVLDDLIKVAPRGNFRDIDLADVYRRAGDNQIALAADDSLIKEFKFKHTSASEYLEHLNRAESYFKDGVKVLNGDGGNDAVAARALTFGDWGLADASAANKPNDSYARSAEEHYKKALSLWKEYKTAQSANGTDDSEKSNSKDKAVLAVLSGYKTLLTAEKRVQEANALDKQIEKILASHPDWHLLF